MKQHHIALLILATFTFAFPGQIAFAQEGLTAKSFEGVWKITKVVKAGVTNNNPQPGLTIFSHGYFTLIRVNSNEARQPSPTPKDPAKLTDAEKIARYDEWAPFTASAGTYEVKGNKLIAHIVVAKAARNMTLSEEVTIKFEGDTFVASSPPGSPNNEQTTYTRVR
ncbi:MAG TPA: hypothetical protein VKB67_04450 [Rhizomicrobium sp.]|nr:hypothetical protein [Rhizomicrobium sp.]